MFDLTNLCSADQFVEWCYEKWNELCIEHPEYALIKTNYRLPTGLIKLQSDPSFITTIDFGKRASRVIIDNGYKRYIDVVDDHEMSITFHTMFCILSANMIIKSIKIPMPTEIVSCGELKVHDIVHRYDEKLKKCCLYKVRDVFEDHVTAENMETNELIEFASDEICDLVLDPGKILICAGGHPNKRALKELHRRIYK